MPRQSKGSLLTFIDYNEVRPQEALLESVKSHATLNYEHCGYDVVVETMEDADILRVIGNSKTLWSALRKVKAHVRPYADQRADVQAEAW